MLTIVFSSRHSEHVRSRDDAESIRVTSCREHPRDVLQTPFFAAAFFRIVSHLLSHAL